MTLDSIVTLVIGAIIGFLVSVAKDLIIENKKKNEKKKQFKREKLEELFVILDKFNDSVMEPISQFSPLEEKAKLGMIIRFYFSDELQDSYKLLLNASGDVLKVKTENNNHLDIYFQKFAPEYIKLLNKIVEESKKYL